jgi:hypothetical protein
MRRRFPLLLAALLAICLTICSPTAALGSAGFEAEWDYPVTVNATSETEPSFTLEAGKVTCKKSSAAGTLKEPSKTLTLHPTFSECSAFGFLSATLTTTGCDFVYGVSTEIATDEFSGTVDISCEKEKAFKIVTATCEVQIGSQSGLGSVTYVNDPKATPDNFKISDSLTKIKYTNTKDGIGCPLSGVGAKEGGTFSDTSRVKGSSGSENVPIAVRPAINKPAWIVGGNYLAGGEEAVVNFEQWGNITFEVAAKNMKVACAKFAGTASLKGGLPGGFEVTALNVFNCTVEKPAGCAIKAIIVQTPWAGNLEIGVLFGNLYLAQRTVYVAFELQNAGCPAGRIPVEGEALTTWDNGSGGTPFYSFIGSHRSLHSGTEAASVWGDVAFSTTAGGQAISAEKVGVP